MTAESRPSGPTLLRLKRLLDFGGFLAPSHAGFGVRLVSAEDGHTVFRMPTAAAQEADGALSVAGMLVLIDGILGSSVGATLPAGRAVTTLTVHVQCHDLRPPAAPWIIGTGRAVHIGDDSGTSIGEITTSAGAPIASASTRCVFRSVPTDPPFGAVAFPVPTTGDQNEPDGWRWRDAIEVVQRSPRTVECVAPALPEWANTGGRVQGGALAAVAERALHQLWTTESRDLGDSPAYDLDITYLHGVLADGHEMTARAEVVHEGRSLVVARSEILDGEKCALTVSAARYRRRSSVS